MSILKIILIGILCLVPEKDGWVRINGDNYISFSFPSRGERFKKEVNNMRSWIFQTKNITCVFGAVCTQLTKETGVLDEYTINQLYISISLGENFKLTCLVFSRWYFALARFWASVLIIHLLYIIITFTTKKAASLYD